MNIKNNNCMYGWVPLKLCKKYTREIAVLFSFATINLSISCSYYTVKDVATTKETISGTIKNFNEQDKYAILHQKDLEWHLNEIVVNEDEQTISGVLAPVSSKHQFEKKVSKKNPNKGLKNKSNKNRSESTDEVKDSVQTYTATRDTKRVHRYKPSKQTPLNEVHFYLNNSSNFNDYQNVSIPFSDVERVSINDKNTGRSIANVLAGTFGTIAFVTLLVAALKSSCPFVYVKHNEGYYFTGELYPGTITSNMQRDDYLALPNILGDNGEYNIKIANHLKEVQYTDVVQLIRFTHNEDIEVLIDHQGKPHTFKNLIAPKRVTMDDGYEQIQPALHKDNDFYAFNTALNNQNSTRQVVFDFEKPSHCKNAKLYVTAKNSVWLDYMYGKFNEQFGSYYNTFQKRQQEVSKVSIENWVKAQNIPLSVYLKTDKGWQLVQNINTVGPMATRDIVVSIPLDDVYKETIQIKLETGFMFWEVDYVAIDYSENERLISEYLKPNSAINQKGKDITELLKYKDANYLVQPNIGDEVTVSFQTHRHNKEAKESLFLLSRGYYNYIRDYKGVPDFERLKEFRKDNVFTKYSEQYYFDIVNFNSKKVAYHE
ncbi:hypothetical protein KFZ70_01480 [Tamlana fucoidanivorans]|uniref:Uncharacterized protein n=1 Tax=Allotamlana fucoidanivorans TaxID=2583814 RepID=A0A5C4SL82_9FLAO|nr:hypothetical protein [Tamlana fucoidanivorans]TNJ44680.1 hypothetical protein FGF67_08545 [Tamlana fucoidanivorans]